MGRNKKTGYCRFCSYNYSKIYPMEILLNPATVNPLETLSKYWATVFELSFTNVWLSKVFSL